MNKNDLPEYSVLMSVYKNDKPDFLDLAIVSMACQTVEPKDLALLDQH